MKVEGGKESLDIETQSPNAASVLRRHPEADAAVEPEPGPLAKTLGSYWRFLLAGVTQHHQTGAVLPSQRFLIEKMIAPVPPDYRGQIVELGAGTGALTRRLAARCPQARILACEINPILAQDLRASLADAGLMGRVQVLCDSADQLLDNLARRGIKPPEFIFSGIPLGNLGRERARALIACINRALRPGGLYIQFQHSLLDRKQIGEIFHQLRTVPVLWNFPPAFVYYAQK